MPLFTKTDNAISINIPRFIKDAGNSISEAKDLNKKLRIMTHYANQLAAAQSDLKETFSEDVRYKAIMKKHGFTE